MSEATEGEGVCIHHSDLVWRPWPPFLRAPSVTTPGMEVGGGGGIGAVSLTISSSGGGMGGGAGLHGPKNQGAV